MNRRILCVAVCLLLVILFGIAAIFSSIKENNDTETLDSSKKTSDIYSFEIRSEETNGEKFVENEYDKSVIPDKYNSGCNEDELTCKAEAGALGGLVLSMSESNLVLNFYSNKKLNENICIENTDFSTYPFKIYSEEILTKKVTILFRNCKFDFFRCSEDGDKQVEYVFENCTFVHCSGSNIRLDRCHFTGGVIDCLNPYNNVEVVNCYFADKSFQDIEDNSGVHTDCVQIYGSQKYGCQNIHFYNCRFEMPYLVGSVNAVNAPIMLAIEFCDAADITFNRCWVNGGGYSIYTTVSNGYHITDSWLKDIHMGCSSRWGYYYPREAEGVYVEPLKDIDGLLVGSVFTKDGVTFISVSNDTNKERTLEIVTNKGKQLHYVKSCFRYDELDDSITFQDFPFDILYEVGTEIEWLVCYDVTDELQRQIRYVNLKHSTVSTTENIEAITK